ncbi:MAG: 3-oxoacyl-ACP synthase III [Planctomycetota bacterium]
MKYDNVFIDAIGYELAPVVVTSEELEERIAPVYEKLRIAPGQLPVLTGIEERRWWEPDTPLSTGAIAAAQQALEKGGVSGRDLGAVIYAGVCRESFEPATACRVADAVGVDPSAAVFDISNACLGVVNGILDVANRIELGQIRAGLVCSCESAREINDVIIAQLLERPEMEFFTKSLATLTGGSGAAAVLVTDGSFARGERHRLLGGVMQTAPEFHALCRWGVDWDGRRVPHPYMYTDSVAVLNNGVELGLRTWSALLNELAWTSATVDRTICHQVGSAHRETVLKMIDVSMERDFVTYPFLGNIGTVSLPLTAAIAAERGMLESGHKVALLGIGSGLNCMMLGLQW